MEPWLKGSLPGLDPGISHLIRAAEHIREDLRNALAPLTAAEIWARPNDLTPAGFHAKHLAGSTTRLCAYLAGRSLTRQELAAIPLKGVGNEDSAELSRQVDQAFDIYEQLVRALHAEDFGTVRYVGRARLPVTAISLAIHIQEHGQRHVGQTISAAKLALALRNA
jgi:hypothetical protein